MLRQRSTARRRTKSSRGCGSQQLDIGMVPDSHGINGPGLDMIRYININGSHKRVAKIQQPESGCQDLVARTW